MSSGRPVMDLLDANWQQQLQTILSVAIATVLGGLVGTERELADRPAGLRTHAILAAAACLLVRLGDILVTHFVADAPAGVLRADPIRIVEAVVTGTAFLGAGTIFRHRGPRDHVEGLTTAASMLLVAAIGIAVALRQLLVAVVITALTLILLRVVRYLFAERKAERTSSRGRNG
ncbi:MAG TPA: MgtC/SapB family protein [Woeseiaceae bacterium]|nr:MgtC/SapB family protein [Woeseiaceae bacterium]